MTEVQGGGKKRTSEVVGMGGGARHPIGQNCGQESTKPVYKEKEDPRTRNSKIKEQVKNRKGESKRCGSHSGKRRTDSVRESRGGRTLTGAALCGRIACSERINLVGGRGWGWRCQAYFWECTDLITIEFAVCDKIETVVSELSKKKSEIYVGIWWFEQI